MIGLDANVLLRYLTADDAVQSPLARDLIDGCLRDGEPLYVSLVTLVETIWTLRSAFGASRQDLCDTVVALATTDGVRLQEPDAVERAVALSRATGCDLSDAIVGELGRAAGCAHTATFDITSARTLDAMELIPAPGPPGGNG